MLGEAWTPKRVSASFDERLLLILSFALVLRILILLRETDTRGRSQQSPMLEK